MKAKDFILHTDFIRENAIAFIKKLECDGKLKIRICNAGDKSSRQRGLQWLWNTDVANSGKGGEHEDTKEGVHLVSKYRWAIPILIRDDPFFADIHAVWVQLYGKDKERMEWFTDTQVHTEKFNSTQMAEFLTEYQKHYVMRGVELSDPEDQKLLYYKRGHVKD